MAQCAPCGQAAEVESLQVLRRRNWPEQWVDAAMPNDLLLLDGPTGRSGGILRLKVPGAFLVLTPEEVWEGKTVPWPVPGSRIRAFRILGQQIRYILR